VPGRLNAPLPAPAPDGRSAPRGPSAHAGSTRSVAGSRVTSRSPLAPRARQSSPPTATRRTWSRRTRTTQACPPSPSTSPTTIAALARRVGASITSSRPPRRAPATRSETSTAMPCGARSTQADRAAGSQPRVPEPDQRGWADPYILRVSRRTRSSSTRSRSQSPRRRTPSPGPLRSNSRRSRSTARRRGGGQRKSRSVTAAGPRGCSPGQVEMCLGEQRQRGFAPASPCCTKRSRPADPIRDRSGRPPTAPIAVGSRP
jgi:hypothetical protein